MGFILRRVVQWPWKFLVTSRRRPQGGETDSSRVPEERGGRSREPAARLLYRSGELVAALVLNLSPAGRAGLS